MGRLDDLAAVCAAAGLVVIEVDGWPSRGRGGTGGHSTGGYGSGAPNHVLVHHTASGPASDGWPDVEYCTFHDDDAPLCNLYLSRDGTVYVCAGMATNCNGSGVDPCGMLEDDTMNANSLAVEAGNDGVGEVWPARQLDAYTALVDALCSGYGIPVARCHSHQEYAPGRKTDPAGPARYASGPYPFDMHAFRADVDHGTIPAPEPAPIPIPEDDEMSLLLQCADGVYAGALAVAPDDLSRILFLSTAEDYAALAATGRYGSAALSGATFERLPGAEQIDVLE